jgi:hypothetical protein
VGEKVSRFHELLSKTQLDNQERNELSKLRKFLAQEVPEAVQFEEERKLRDELRSLVETLEAQTK